MSIRQKSPAPISKQQDSPENQLRRKVAEEAQRKRSKKNNNDFLNQYGYHIVIGGIVAILLIAIGVSQLYKKSDQTPIIVQEEINAHNQKQIYKLGENKFFDQMMISQVNQIINNLVSNKKSVAKCKSLQFEQQLPESYNFRTQFKECARPVQVQKSNCSSSYSIASVGAINDRYCAYKNIKEVFSPQQILSCDFDNNNNTGCKGGYITNVLDYAKKHGLVKQECLKQNPQNNLTTCDDLEQCQKFRISDYCVVINGEEEIKREIFKNGPVISALPVFTDFLVYKSGIFEIQQQSKFKNLQIIKIIGWDLDKSTMKKYWIVENSWGESWGEAGFAKIGVGQKDLQLELYAISPILVEGSTLISEHQMEFEQTKIE